MKTHIVYFVLPVGYDINTVIDNKLNFLINSDEGLLLRVNPSIIGAFGMSPVSRNLINLCKDNDFNTVGLLVDLYQIGINPFDMNRILYESEFEELNLVVNIEDCMYGEQYIPVDKYKDEIEKIGTYKVSCDYISGKKGGKAFMFEVNEGLNSYSELGDSIDIGMTQSNFYYVKGDINARETKFDS